MRQVRLLPQNDRWKLLLLFRGCLFLLLFALPAAAKVATDFDPNLDFSKYKTFAYIGGVENLDRMQMNPDLLGNRIHRSVTRELTAKGLREVTPEEDPDLVVRYWVDTQVDANVSTGSSTNWGVYGSYYGYHWGPIYNSMTAYSTRQGTLGIELINAKTKDLAWRMFASAKLYHTDPDKIWKTADDNIKNAFNGYPPSPKAIEAKKKAWAKEDAAKKLSQQCALIFPSRNESCDALSWTRRSDRWWIAWRPETRREGMSFQDPRSVEVLMIVGGGQSHGHSRGNRSYR